ncbi:MAG TPA: hypothetical protein VFR81_11440 [Longimicrobium sp.]|nr:hypothetical protein [Longimicrobium sp.]
MRDFRNLVAHHQPIWDRQVVVASHRRALELLRWLNPTLAAVAEDAVTTEKVYDAGPAAWRDFAAGVLTV